MSVELYAKVSIRVVTEEWRPFNYTNEHGELVGRATKKVKRILDALNYSYTINSYPWLRSMQLAENTKNTLIYSIYRTPEREHRFQWVCPLIPPVKVYLFKLRKRNNLTINSLEEAKNYVISVNRADSGHEYLRSKGFVEGVNLDITADPDASPRKLFASRVDFLMQSEWEMVESVKRVGKRYDEVERLIEVNSVNALKACMAFSLSTDSKIVAEFRQALENDNQRFKLELMNQLD